MSTSVREMRGLRSCVNMHKRTAFLGARQHYMSHTPPLVIAQHCAVPCVEQGPPPIRPVNVACPATLPSCKPPIRPKCDFQAGSCFKRNLCPNFATLLHNYVMYFMVLFMDIKHKDEARRESTIVALQSSLEEFNNLLGPDFQHVLEPVSEAIIEVAQARLTDGSIDERQMLLDDAMEKLRALSNMLGLYFGSMSRENPRFCKDEKLLCCIRDGWGIIVNAILEMVYTLEEDDRDATAFNRAALNAFNGATVFGKFLDQLCLKPKEPCPNGVTMFDDSKRTLIQRQVSGGDTTTTTPLSDVENPPVSIGEMMDEYDVMTEIGLSLHDIVAESDCTESDKVTMAAAKSPYTTIAENTKPFDKSSSPIESSYEFVAVEVSRRDDDKVVKRLLSNDVTPLGDGSSSTNVNVARKTLMFPESDKTEVRTVSGTLFTIKKEVRINEADSRINFHGDDAEELTFENLKIGVSLILRYTFKNGGRTETIRVALSLDGVTERQAKKSLNHFLVERPVVTSSGNVYVIVAVFNFTTASERWKQLSIGDIYVFTPDFKDRFTLLNTFEKSGGRVTPVLGRSQIEPFLREEMIGAEEDEDQAKAKAKAKVQIPSSTFSGLSKNVQKLDTRYKVPVGKLRNVLPDGDTSVRRATLTGTVTVQGGDIPIVELEEKEVFIGRYEGGGASGDKLLFLQQIGGEDYVEFPIKGRTKLNVTFTLSVVDKVDNGTIRGARLAGGREDTLARSQYTVRGVIDLTADSVDQWDGKYQTTSITADNGRTYVVRLRVAVNDAAKLLHGELDTNLYGVGSIAFLISDPKKKAKTTATRASTAESSTRTRSRTTSRRR